MLKQLYLKNIVLIEEAVIPFKKGFNVISGETGAGKSALMAALQQIHGFRADLQLIRHGFDKGIVEAVFDIDKLPKVQQMLNESGIDHATGDELLVRREISRTGKSRLFINSQLTHLSTLQAIGGSLFKIVSQRGSQQLFDLDHHLELLDSYGDLKGLRAEYQSAFDKEMDTRKKLERLKNSEQKRIREQEVCLRELEELTAADLQEGEEEELFAEYTKLTNTETLLQLSESITSTLDDQILPALRSVRQSAERLLSLDSLLAETHEQLASSALEIEELTRSYHDYSSSIEHNPYKTETINQRLTLINKVKKKYGPTIEEAIRYKHSREELLASLENAETEIEELAHALQEQEKGSQELAEKLTKERNRASLLFSEAMTKELRDLNMPYSIFSVKVEMVDRGKTGQDKVEFYFAPNKGEKTVSIRECASGGEISRIQLSIQTLLAGKESMPSLIFDEIDANIGGQTAAIVGKKLQQIGKNHQLLCITHFPQVADSAVHHIQISKKEKDERTVSVINVLRQEGKESELLRMAGKAI